MRSKSQNTQPAGLQQPGPAHVLPRCTHDRNPSEFGSDERHELQQWGVQSTRKFATYVEDSLAGQVGLC